MIKKTQNIDEMKLTKTISRSFLALLLLSMFFGKLMIITAYAQETKSELPAKKQTSLDLYVTSAEAYAKWQASPESVKILDVRTPEEYIFVGHAPMAYNVPIAEQSYEWDPITNEFKMKQVSSFVEQVKNIALPTDTILVTCRSGGRSAMAVNQLAAAGYLYVYNISDGFEGDMVKDSTSLYYKKRIVNGWKNSGLPWTYELSKDLIVLPETIK